MKLTQRDSSTEQRVLQAARKVFQQKGLHGARMQDIADKAGINKAMLHYYFRTKEQLFESVFFEALQKFIPSVQELWASSLPFEEKLKNFIGAYMNMLLENPFLPAFIIHEMNQDASRFQKHFLKIGVGGTVKKFIQQIQEENTARKSPAIDPRQLLVNILSLCIFPFAAKPMITKIMGLSEKEFQLFIQERKEIVTRLILQTIKQK